MQIDGAVLREQGLTFAVVVVRPHVVRSSHEAERAIMAFRPAFPGLPVVLMAQDGRGTPTYYGRQDIARFLASVPANAIPWRRYTLN